MCKCTPSLRTMFCGKPGCEMPVQNAIDPTPARLMAIADEIAELQASGDLKAIACVLILPNGDLRTLHCFSDGHKLPLLAGTSILHKDMLDMMVTVRDRSID